MSERVISSPKELFEVLAAPADSSRTRMVYEAQDGSYWVDWGGRVLGSVLGAALTMNRLKPAYPGCPDCKAWRLIHEPV